MTDVQKQECQIPINDVITLDGTLAIPEGAQGIVLFAHGSGSSRFSRRNLYVAQVLQEAGIATLLMDLLTRDEEVQDQVTAALRFDIHLLSERVGRASEWLSVNEKTAQFSLGYFGASTGAAAALVAASQHPLLVKAVVSRGGRPDLAGAALKKVKAPTLLIVGLRDPQVLELNRQAYDVLQVEKQLDVVEGATHLFEEPGALEQVAALARTWFQRYLAG
ncbi:dienelactone hydrolase family protein [Thermosporothrix hazakensis]|jgi:dienelactone hydrolase|uniref:Dienelactone hydrolase family protein n=2 Tax=Thermosporothrix TaxID=768650 RepID=A0A326U8K8_THEHA|nr:dienelactone hydrolase family protein [Thermosporothrix hazakensis]PZW30506.1 dienelactone hydrolase family protein [Thermosporothrix hazakensis]BBH91220.1 DeoR family transcriptional regulator [Thermosporothrix sp. COM3]GCE49366.1 DeoR family transcriptional regulator [Thermosporothrix hazakensis]